MSFRELSKYTFYSRYSNHREQRRETWEESVDRQMDMHLTKYVGNLCVGVSPEEFEDLEIRYTQVTNYIEQCREAVKEKKVLGSQRALQFGGEPILKKNARIYNCAGSFCDRLRFFQEAFWLLLCGTGTGFSVQRHHVESLPTFSTLRWRDTNFPGVIRVNGWTKVYTIPDSIEGWADALGVLLSSYFEGDVPFPAYQDCDVVFDYSLIRPKGAVLRSSSGKAPGPEPLEAALEKVRALLERCLDDGLRRLRPIDAYDIVMHVSDAVLSGGVRRSATICIFSADDTEMASAKTGDWYYTNPQRGRSNNSALLLRGKTKFEDFQKLMESVQQYGEPGFYWSDSTEQVPNPCCEIGFYPVWESEDGKQSGWCFCNLTEINGKVCKTDAAFMEAAEAAAILGTLQAGYTDFPYLGDVTERIVRAEALLGVSITGINDNPDVLLDPQLQRKAAKVVKDTNEKVARLLGIEPAARATCIKPSGTASCLLGTGSGIHPHHYTRYFRRVQSNKMEAPFQHFAKVNPLAVEDSVWSANRTDGVITFCIEVEPGARTKNKIGAVDLLENVKSTYLNWVLPGTRKDRCLKPYLTHNVSNTINVKEDEWEEVTKFIYDNRKFFSGISILPVTGDKDYAQAPFCAVYTPRQMVQEYGDGAVIASGIIERGLAAFDNDLWAACDTALGLRTIPELVPTEEGLVFTSENLRSEVQRVWIDRLTRFSDRYFEGDLRKATYCLKDVHNWKLWLDLTRETKEVDYTTMVEEEDGTNFTLEPACSGGSCAI